MTGKCGETPSSLSGPCVSKGGCTGLEEDISSCCDLGSSFAWTEVCSPLLSLLHPAYSQSLDVGLAAGLVLLEGQSTARQLHHAEKCTGVVYVAVVCERRLWVGVRILGS